MKTFEPKITAGPWDIVIQDECEIWLDEYDPHKEATSEDIKAMNAVPEMLEVVRAVDKLFKEEIFTDLGEKISLRKELIFDLGRKLVELKEKHGTEVYDEENHKEVV